MEHGFTHETLGALEYLTIPSFTRTGKTRHCFSTRLGGVSRPPLHSMNLGLNRGDDREAVLENYRILGKAAGFDPERLIFFHQVHGKEIFVARAEDAGCAFQSLSGYDGIVTQVKNLPIATFHADCVPVFLLDPVREAIGVAHAGWRGTALCTPAHALQKMCSEFGTDPRDVLAAIGPCSGVCCYETDGDVPAAMREAFGSEATPYLRETPPKWHVDLPGLNRLALLQAGIPPEQITMSGECTCCDPERYWSHRKTGGVRGAMAAILMLTEQEESK